MNNSCFYKGNKIYKLHLLIRQKSPSKKIKKIKSGDRMSEPYKPVQRSAQNYPILKKSADSAKIFENGPDKLVMHSKVLDFEGFRINSFVSILCF